MNILLIYPRYPDTFWSFRHALKFVSKKAANIPLGIITVAAMLPKEWDKRLVDLNVDELKDKDLEWADYAFISAMAVQTTSAKQVIERCVQAGVPTVAGGPLFTENYDQFPQVDHLILNEAEITLPLFLSDLKSNKAQKIYRSHLFSEIDQSPVPDYSLLQLEKYATACIQFSRGCPFDCEFCDITALYGPKVRTKTPEQIIAELDNLLSVGWKGSVFFVDDNFIGHKKQLKTDLLPKLISWMKENNRPFNFSTEASINLTDDQELMDMMVEAGFAMVFVGIETPHKNSLIECNKVQNSTRDLLQSVHQIQQSGIEVTAGFIVGFDHDPSDIFQQQIEFIQQSGIITAMVGLLNAPRLSKLYKRLKSEGRITDDFSGDNTNYSMNFTPIMNKEILLNGYHKIVHDIYSAPLYYQRVKKYLSSYKLPYKKPMNLSFNNVKALAKTFFYIGIVSPYRRYFWNLFTWSLFYKPAVLVRVLTYSVYGYHFRKVFNEIK